MMLRSIVGSAAGGPRGLRGRRPRLFLHILVVAGCGVTGSAALVTLPATAAAKVVAPANTALPAISGTAKDGQTLSASTGTWSGTAPISYTYQWNRCNASGASCVGITGATAATRTVAAADVGSTLRVGVTAKNSAASTSATSSATAVVQAVAPANTALPAISGTAKDGQTLSASTGTWSGTAPISYTYQWELCDGTGASCAVIVGGTGSTYTLGSFAIGFTVRAQVTASNASSTIVTATSAATPVVTASPPVQSVAPVLSGVAQDTSTLSVDNGTWVGTTPFSYAFQWQTCDSGGANCVDIPGANATTFPLTSTYAGIRLRVTVTVSNSVGSSTYASMPTDAVRQFEDATAGMLDSGFGAGGMASGPGPFSGVWQVVAGVGGQIVAVGGISQSDTDPGSFAVTRYNANGSLDTGFAAGGTASAGFADPNHLGTFAANAVVLKDGSTLAVGNAPDPSASYGSQAFALVRYRSDGSLDQTFGSGGLVTTHFPDGASGAVSVVVQSDGKILVGGDASASNLEFAIARYNANGTLDTSFGSGGLVTRSLGTSSLLAAIAGMALAPDGKVIMAGWADTSTCNCQVIARFNTDGSPDTSFGTGGEVRNGAPNDQGMEAATFGVAVQTDGKIVTTGSSYDPRYLCTVWTTGAPSNDCFSDVAVARLNADGTPDPNFGDHGWVQTYLPSLNTRADQTEAYGQDVTIAPDGDIVVAALHQTSIDNTNPETVILRYLPDGTRDPGLGACGKVTAAAAIPHGLIVTPGGKIVVGLNPYAFTGVSYQLGQYLGGTGAAADGCLLSDFAPEMIYDSQEPYLADSVAEITDDVRVDNYGHVTAPLLHRADGSVLADPLFGQSAYAAQYGYQIQGSFPLTIGNLGSYYGAGFQAPDPAGNTQSGDYIDEPDNYMSDAAYLHAKPGYANHIYGHVVHENGETWLQYWFFYYYNNGVVGVGDHEGDWEMTQVRLNGSYQPDEAVFSEHSYASRCTVGQFERSTGGGPIVYSANGSHASYPHAGTWNTDSPFTDSISPDPSAIPPVWPQVDPITDGSPSWVDWPGMWGASVASGSFGEGSSPPGPKQHSEQWTDPQAWADQAGGCLDRQNVIPTPHVARSVRMRSTSSQRAANSSQAPAPRSAAARLVRLTSARITARRVHVSYRITVPVQQNARWPRLELTVDSPDDNVPPQSVVVAHVRNRGSMILPFKLSSHELWIVRASLFWPRSRSLVVSRLATPRPTTRPPAVGEGPRLAKSTVPCTWRRVSASNLSPSELSDRAGRLAEAGHPARRLRTTKGPGSLMPAHSRRRRSATPHVSESGLSEAARSPTVAALPRVCQGWRPDFGPTRTARDKDVRSPTFIGLRLRVRQ
jgi:uncharacterized delta-60 repeat protein